LIQRFQKQFGKRLDHDERKRKREAREGHKASERAQNLRGLRAKLYAESRRKEKISMKKAIRAKEERNVKSAGPQEPSGVPQPEYLLDRSSTNNAKALSSQIKQKRAEKAAKFSVPLPKVRGISESEVFSVMKTGKKTHKKAWKRVYALIRFLIFHLSWLISSQDYQANIRGREFHPQASKMYVFFEST
jgi:ribosome biogenesis protein NSA2